MYVKRGGHVCEMVGVCETVDMDYSRYNAPGRYNAAFSG